MARFFFVSLSLMLLALPASGQFLDPSADATPPGAAPPGQQGFNENWGIEPGAAPGAGGFQDQGLGFGAPADDFSSFGGAGQADFFATSVDDFMESRITVLKGRWISDAVTGQLLDVPEITSDDEGNRQAYWNDGIHGGDIEADDEIWSNVEVQDDDYIGAQTQTYIRYYINMLRLLNEMNSLDFAGAPVASPDPNSPLPLLDIYMSDQENWILGWNEEFLFPFRQPDPITGVVSARGEFFPVYVPPPPMSGPARPRPQFAEPPPDFLEQAWVAFQGGVPDVNQITSVRGSANPQGGGQYNLYGEPGFGGADGADAFSQSAANENTYSDTGRSTYW